MADDLKDRLRDLGLLAVASGLDDLIAVVTKQRSSPQQILEHVASLEEKDRARRSLESRKARSRLGRFKPIADFDWAWRIVAEHRLHEACDVLFSPSAAQLPARDLADWIVAAKLPVRFQLQLHKLLWNDEPGR